MKKTSGVFSLILLLLCLTNPFSIQADVAPPPTTSLGGFSPFIYQETEVQMMYERVEIEVKGSKEMPAETQFFTYDTVEVVAWFVMHNHGVQDEEMQVVFPVDNLEGDGNCSDLTPNTGITSYLAYKSVPESFQVVVDGVLIKTESVISPHPYYDEEKCPGKDFEWIGFNVKFPSGKDVMLRVAYTMRSFSNDSVSGFQYILETGAGWKGSIKDGYIVFRFPYEPGESILETTTPGYVREYNEIYWRINDLEPTRKDNIYVSFVSPDAWVKILSNQSRIYKDPNDVEAWVGLAKEYERIAYFQRHELRIPKFSNFPELMYQRGLYFNPESADINAEYVKYILTECCTDFVNKPSQSTRETIIQLINNVFRSDPSYKFDQDYLNLLMDYLNFEIVYPSTFTSIPGSIGTLTPIQFSTQIKQPIESTNRIEIQELEVAEVPSATISPTKKTDLSPVSTKVLVTKTPNKVPLKDEQVAESKRINPLMGFIVVGLLAVVILHVRQWQK